MSSNPNEVKSQDFLNDCNSGKRKSEVLIISIEKLEDLQKQLDKAEWILKELATGHQSRNKYNKLIGMAQIYFKENKDG